MLWLLFGQVVVILGIRWKGYLRHEFNRYGVSGWSIEQGGDSFLGNGVSVSWERFSHRKKAIQTHLEVLKWVTVIKNTICGICEDIIKGNKTKGREREFRDKMGV